MTTIQRLIVVAHVAAFAALPASASSVIQLADPLSAVGIPYRWQVTLGGNDSGIASRHVGAWSWEDNALFNAGLGEPPVGWTHTSDWVQLALTQPSTFTLRLERDATVPWPSGTDPFRLASIASMFPSFTIWNGWDTDGTQDHTFNNRGNVSWAESVSVIAFFDNSTQPVAEQSWALPAGNYSIVLGSNAPANDTDRQGYRATFTTAPIPEPSTATLLLCAAPFLIRRRTARVCREKR